MATATSTARRSTRFSLLLLEHSEVLLSDFAVQYRFIPDTTTGGSSSLHPLSSYPQSFVTRSANAAIPGRIKLATHSLFFDSDDWRHPVIRVPLLSVEMARLTRDQSRSRDSPTNTATPSSLSSLQSPSSSSSPSSTHGQLHAMDGDLDNSVLVIATSATFQRELAIDHPYIDVQIRGRHIFTPLYTSSLSLLDDMHTLLRITSTSSSRVRQQRLKQLVQQRESLVPFDLTLLQHGVNENALMESPASAVYPMSTQPGRFRITSHNIYFMPVHGESSQIVERISVDKITTIRTLRHGYRDAALEIAYHIENPTSSSTTYATLMLSFQSAQLRKRAIDILQDVADHQVEKYDRRQLEVALTKWRNGAMSNFDYLMYLNYAAGRSFNDLSQYPIFPWVVQDYTSTQLDLTNPSTFRDLSKPIGALNNSRLETFSQTYHEMPPPKFFYGTHYSTPAYVINYLLRAAPAAMLRLQNGRFDIPDRLFHNISSSWGSVLHNRGDVKELIPEFYTLNFNQGMSSGVISSSSMPGEFLDNVLGLDLGTRQDGIRVDDVELPLWANTSSQLFVHKLREALECEYVSRHLHMWIDLIFGVKSRNADACNIFYTDVAVPETIEAAEERKIQDEELSQIETIYLEFGRTPRKLFQNSHPPRFGDSDGSESSGADVDVISAGEEEANVKDIGNELAQPHIGADPVNIQNDDGLLPADVSAKRDTLTEVELSLRKNSSTNSLKRKPRPRIRSGNPECTSTGMRYHILPVNCGESGATSICPEVDINYIVKAAKAPSTSSISTSSKEYAQIMDMCVVKRSEISTGTDEDASLLCTMWDTGYLKVNCGTKSLRSKLISGACSVTFLDDDMIAYGSRDGSIGVFYIGSARDEVLQEGAHDGEIGVLNFVREGNVLVSGSKDGSVKIWCFERSGDRVTKLRLVQEVDAENCVEDACAIHRQSGEERQVLVAAWTSEGSLLVWELQLDGGEPFVEPIWRREANGTIPTGPKIAKRRKNIVTWLDQGPKRKPLLVCANEHEQCVRVWRMEEEVTVTGEVYLSTTETMCLCGSGGSRTFLVASNKGKIEEYDSTGLCIGKMKIGDLEVLQMKMCRQGSSLIVWDGQDGVYHVRLRQ